MKRIFFSIITLLILYSCSNVNSASTKPFNYGKTALATLKEVYKTNLNDEKNIGAVYYFVRKHADEVLKNLEVVEEVEVQKDVNLVFFRYSIGTDIVKKTMYMRKIDNQYLPFYTYYSEYKDDPFNNGKGEEGKALLKKANEWEESNIWWAL